MMSPAAFPRRVLFTVTGLTPQIVTETIYGLAVKQTPPFLPTQLVVMTTSDGANRARLTLQGNDPGWLRRLCKDYDLPPIQFGDEDIRVLRAKGGAALPDIRSGEDHYRPVDGERTFGKHLIQNGFCAIFRGVDLKLAAISGMLFRGGSAHECRKDDFLATDGLPAMEHVRPACRASSRRPRRANISLHRAIPGHGLCPTDVSGKPARH